MTTSFPRSNLNPEADAWRRKVEQLLREALDGTSTVRRSVRAYQTSQAGLVDSLVGQARTLAEHAESIRQHDEIIVPIDPPAKPTMPTLATSLGVVVATWDGMLLNQDGDPIPPTSGFKSVQAEIVISEAEVDDPESAGVMVKEWGRVAQPLLNAGGVSIAELPVGSTAIVRFIAVNAKGEESIPSESATIVVDGVKVGEIMDGAVISDSIAADAVGTVHLVNGAVTREILAAQAVGPNEIADFAVEASKLKIKSHILF